MSGMLRKIILVVFSSLLMLVLAACDASEQTAEQEANTAPVVDSADKQVAAEQQVETQAVEQTATESDSDLPPPLPIEPIGVIESLPETYPDSWFIVIESAFMHMLDGKAIVIDSAKDTVPEQVKGTFNISMIGNFIQSDKNAEFYVTETFHSRGSRGDRTDVVTIYDKVNLAPVAEVVWPTPKRFQGMPERYAMALINDDKLLLVFNFNPATSVTVIDTKTRKIVSEVQIPGCAMIYPTGQSSFTSICSNGGLLSSTLNADGSLVKQTRIDPFFDPMDTPVFERPAIVNGIAYFPGFDGQVYPVDLTGDEAKVGEKWHLVPESERAENWRPGGVGIVDIDSKGHFYLLMHPDGREGSQNEGGNEVWVYDAASKTRVSRIALKEWGLSIGVSRGEQPVLLVTNPTNMSLEVYDVESGQFQRTISGIGEETPLMLFGAGNK